MRKMKIILVFCLVITMLFGCSGEKKTIYIDVDYLCNELLENADFEDELSSIDDNMIKKLYNIDDYVNASVYLGSGATAEEVAIFEFDDNEKAQEGLNQVMNRLENQKNDFGSYIPKEVKKLDDAFAGQYGKYIIVCVSNSGRAEEVITQYLEKSF